MLRTSMVLMCALAIAGCKDDDDGGNNQIADADPGGPDARPVDAAVDSSMPSTVEVVKCEGTIVKTVTVEGGNAFKLAPDENPISVNSVVRFQISAGHSAVSGMNAADGKFRVSSGEDKCLKFTAIGEYPFYCDPHGFKATLTVVIH